MRPFFIPRLKNHEGKGVRERGQPSDEDSWRQLVGGHDVKPFPARVFITGLS